MFTKGNTYSIGNKGGRKAKKIEMELAKEAITQDALIKLANSKVYKQLVALQDFKDTKEMALPITLRGIIERKDITSLGEKITPIYNGQSVTSGVSVQGHDSSSQDIPVKE